MGLRAEAEAALEETLEDEDLFGWPLTITDPSGFSAHLSGGFTDISRVIDPETGVAVTGRLASAVVRLSTLSLEGFTAIPRGISESASKPWRVDTVDINGNACTFKVQESNPDRALGIVVLILELYTP